MSFRIFTDSSASIPSSLLREKNIDLVSMYYTTPDGVEHICQTLEEDFNGDEFYEDIRTNHSVVRTSLINSARFAEAFESCCAEGEDVLYIGLSSGVSGTYNAAVLAAEELSEKYPDRRILTVDSLGAALGEGLLVLEAAELRDDGVDIADAASRIDELKQYMCQRFIVDDLVALRRTGRLSSAGAFVGTLMNIKPVLMGSDVGTIICIAKERGRRRAIARLADMFENQVVDADLQTVGITHTGCREEAEALAEMLRERCGVRDFLIVDHEPGTGSHLGPDAIALFFYGTDARSSEIPGARAAAGAFAQNALKNARIRISALRAAVKSGTAAYREAKNAAENAEDAE